MDKSEYWLLRYVVRTKEPLTMLTENEVHLTEWCNLPHHGLERSSLISTLDRLFQNGDLIAERPYQGELDSDCNAPESVQVMEPRTLFVPTRHEIEGILEREQDWDMGDDLTYYGLTAQGGQRWEEVARPDWNLFSCSSTHLPRGYYFDITVSANREFIAEYPEWKFSQGIYRPKTDPLWQTLSPWQATYWKQLPYGYRVCFAYESIPLPPEIQELRAILVRYMQSRENRELVHYIGAHPQVWAEHQRRQTEYGEQSQESRHWYEKHTYWLTEPFSDSNPNEPRA